MIMPFFKEGDAYHTVLFCYGLCGLALASLFLLYLALYSRYKRRQGRGLDNA